MSHANLNKPETKTAVIRIHTNHDESQPIGTSGEKRRRTGIRTGLPVYIARDDTTVSNRFLTALGQLRPSD